MHPHRRRKKRPNYGLRTLEVTRGPHGFGFTISGQQPCILSCIVPNSPADLAGLKAGDFLISVNGSSVSKSTHDAVVGLIGNCMGPIKMTIAEHYYSDSSSDSDENSKQVYNKPRVHRKFVRSAVQKCVINNNNVSVEDDLAAPIEYRAIVGYLGTIEMPKQMLPNSRLQTVCSCIRKLRAEKRTPTSVLMTVLPTCLTLKNASNQILAIYPTNRVVYISSSMEKGCRYFGLVTSAVNDARCPSELSSSTSAGASVANNACSSTAGGGGPSACPAPNSSCHDNINDDIDIDISNSCHVFVTDPKMAQHTAHANKAEQFGITCSTDGVWCVEFPRSALYIVSLVQNLYRLEVSCGGAVAPVQVAPPAAPISPQPSASSNSDSGIGFRDDCSGVVMSDRILVVEFPYTRPYRVQLKPGSLAAAGSRPANITAHLNNTTNSYIKSNCSNNGNVASCSANGYVSSNCINNVASSSANGYITSNCNKNGHVASTSTNGYVTSNCGHINGNVASNSGHVPNVPNGEVRLNNVATAHDGDTAANLRVHPDGLSIKNVINRSHANTDFLIKQNNTTEVQQNHNHNLHYNGDNSNLRLTVRALAPPHLHHTPSTQPHSPPYNERPIDVCPSELQPNTHQYSSDVFKTPQPVAKAAKRSRLVRRRSPAAAAPLPAPPAATPPTGCHCSCDSLLLHAEMLTGSHHNFSVCEESGCNNSNSIDIGNSAHDLSMSRENESSKSSSALGGSWQNLALWATDRKRKQLAHSEPDVRTQDRYVNATSKVSVNVKVFVFYYYLSPKCFQ